MAGFTNTLAIVIPTKDRPSDLRRMLQSVQDQTVLPEQIVVVDGGEDKVDTVVREYPSLGVEYVRVYPPSLARQRNEGMMRLRDDVSLAGYLDDDLVLESAALEGMLDFWESASPEVGGARFHITNEPLPRGIWIKSLLLTESRKRGAVLPSGFSTGFGPVAQTGYVRWLSGGATIWRREVIDEYQYDDWFSGTGYLEDVDYSLRVSRKYRLAVVKEARLEHLSPPLRRDRSHLLGKWQVINRMYLAKKHKEISVPLCYWALLGLTALNIGKWVYRRDTTYLDRARGNFVGLARVLTGRIDRIGGALK